MKSWNLKAVTNRMWRKSRGWKRTDSQFPSIQSKWSTLPKSLLSIRWMAWNWTKTSLWSLLPFFAWLLPWGWVCRARCRTATACTGRYDDPEGSQTIYTWLRKTGGIKTHIYKLERMPLVCNLFTSPLVACLRHESREHPMCISGTVLLPPFNRTPAKLVGTNSILHEIMSGKQNYTISWTWSHGTRSPLKAASGWQP